MRKSKIGDNRIPGFRNTVRVVEMTTLMSLLAAIGNVQAAPAGDIVAVAQQTKTVTGVVKDAAGEPIIGANIVVKGTTNGTVTDLDGNFTLQCPPNAVLVVTYVGFT